MDGRVIASAPLRKDDSADLAGAVATLGPVRIHEVRLRLTGMAVSLPAAKVRRQVVATELVRYLAF